MKGDKHIQILHYQLPPMIKKSEKQEKRHLCTDLSWPWNRCTLFKLENMQLYERTKKRFLDVKNTFFKYSRMSSILKILESDSKMNLRPTTKRFSKWSARKIVMFPCLNVRKFRHEIKKLSKPRMTESRAFVQGGAYACLSAGRSEL